MTDIVKGMADVCAWTQEGWEYRRAGCRGWSFHIYSEKYAPKRNRCHLCSRPIEFKSAAIRAAAGEEGK